MPSTFTHALLPTSCVLASKRVLPSLNFKQWLKLLFVSMVLGNSCDLDLVPAFSMPSRWLEIHRFWGHNIFMISIWIALGAFMLSRWVAPQLKGRTAWILAISLVLSHVLFDAMGDYTGRGFRVGVPLFYPFTKWEFLLPFPVFKGVRLAPHIHPALAHVLSRQFWTDGIIREFCASVVLFVIYCTLLTSTILTGRLFSRRRISVSSEGRAQETAYP